jgi:uncharacterized protein (DUF2236 family)
VLPFDKASIAHRVNMEPVIALGGGRALLLQVLHPLVAAGVDNHSNFTDEPFRRGFRTADIMLKLAFGDAATSKRQAEILRRMHERVKGATSDGEVYDALDPGLLVWVWATLVDVSLLMYERGVRSLTSDERERYYQEQKLIAYACGVPEGGCPDDLVAFERYFDDMLRTKLRVTKTARLVAFAGRKPPLPRPFDRLAGGVVTLFTAGMLPETLRDELGYEWTPGRQRVLDAAFFLSRLTAKVVPRAIRHVPNRYLIRRKTPLGWWKGRRIAVEQVEA